MPPFPPPLLVLVPWFAVPAILVGPAADAPAPSPQDLDALLARLRGPAAGDRLAAAHEIAAAPPTGFELYVQRLRRPRPVTPESFRKLVLESWGQVPNPNYAKDGQLWARKPDPPWKAPPVVRGQPRPKRPPGHDPEKTEWLAALNDLDLDGNTVTAALPDRVEARALAMEAVALMRAVAATGRSDALDPIFDFAFDFEGVFRDECGRTIRSMEARALPGLIHRMHTTAKGITAYRQRRYASYQLDRMDRASPLKAIGASTDDRTRAEILHAYGETRALEAVEAVLGQVDAPSRRVREEARWAWLRYVTGPLPPEMPKRKRKLPGGRAETEEKEDYLNYREMALLVLARTLAVVHGDAECAACPKGSDVKPPPLADAAAMTAELFTFYDQRREAEWGGMFQGAQAKARSGDLAGAVGDFGWILAHDPFYERRGEMVAAFVDYGQSLLDREPQRAATYLQQAAMLDPASDKARHAQAWLSLLDAEEKLRGGRPDPAAFQRALDLDPSLERARHSLALIEARRNREGWMLTARLTALALPLPIALVLGVRLARRRRRAGSVGVRSSEIA